MISNIGVNNSPNFVNLRYNGFHICIFLALKTLHYHRYWISNTFITLQILTFTNWPHHHIFLHQLLFQFANLFFLLAVDLSQNCHLLFRFVEIFLSDVVGQLSFKIHSIVFLLFPVLVDMAKLFLRDDNFIFLQQFLKLFNSHTFPLKTFLGLFSNSIIST